MNSGESAAFKTCPCCRTVWLSKNDLLRDRSIRYLGFQAGADGRLPGMFLFNHRSCGTTLALDVPALEDLSRRPVLGLSQCSTGTSPEYCLAKSRSEPCPLYCACEFVADVGRTVRAWPKDEHG